MQWNDGSALNLQTVMNLKGMKRNKQAVMLERFGVDLFTAMKEATVGANNMMLTGNIQVIGSSSPNVTAKVNMDTLGRRFVSLC